MTYGEIQIVARALGITAMKGRDLADYARYSDGCTCLSWLYALRGKRISCQRACVAHDFLYEWGGDGEARRQADMLLWICAANSGKGSPGWRGFAIRIWRELRAWIMYGSVRLCGWKYWKR